MNCVRCQNHDAVGNGLESTKDEFNYKDPDIGGFAEISGCLHKLKDSEKQVGQYNLIAFIY